MTHTYTISGMTCSSCEKKVTALLSKVPGVNHVKADLKNGSADIWMEHHIQTATLQAALQETPAYQLKDRIPAKAGTGGENQEPKKSWFQTYKPIVLIFSFITTVSLIAGISGGLFNILSSMRVFMAGFFLVFSFFKFLDLDGFADSYSTYDIVAKKYRSWAYLYAFIELLLGLAYATDFQPGVINYITLIVMSVSMAGVLQAVLNKRKIRCACLGAVFNLPMSTVTIFEDSLMIAMSIVMLGIMA